MRARDLALPYPVVAAEDPAIDAAHQLADEQVDVVLVRGPSGSVKALDDLALLRFLLPDYLLADRALARVVGQDVSQLLSRLEGKTAGDLIGRDRPGLPRVSTEAHLVEVACEMVAQGAGLVAVVEGDPHDGEVVGGITTSALLTVLLGSR